MWVSMRNLSSTILLLHVPLFLLDFGLTKPFLIFCHYFLKNNNNILSKFDGYSKKYKYIMLDSPLTVDYQTLFVTHLVP